MQKSLLKVLCVVMFAVLGMQASASRQQALRPTRAAAPERMGAMVSNTLISIQAVDDYSSVTDWKSIGTGKFTGAFVAWATGDTGYCTDLWDVEVEESESNPGLYRVVNPYANCEYATEYYEVDTENDYYMIVDATNPDAVQIPIFCTGVTPYYLSGSVVNTDNAMVWGRSGDTGKMVDKVLSFEAGALWNNLTGEDANWVSGNYPATTFVFRLPGAIDHSYTLTPGATCNDANEATISLIRGANIGNCYAKLSLGSEADFSDAMRVEENLLDPAETDYTFAMTESGTYTLSVVILTDEGEFLKSAYYRFVNPDESDNWTSLGQALVTDNIYLSLYGSGYFSLQKYNAEVQESKTTPGLYRLVNPFANNEELASGIHSGTHNHYVYIDASNPEAVSMPVSAPGVSMYGERVTIGSNVTSSGTYTDGVITFPANTLWIRYGAIYYDVTNGDFKVVIPKEHTVTVVSQDNSAYGTVAITSPATTGNTVTTSETSVTIEATPKEGYSLYCWHDSNGSTVSTSATYTYEGSADETFTAYFGSELTYSVVGSTGTSASNRSYLEAIQNDGEDSSVSSGSLVPVNARVDFTLTLRNDELLKGVTVNGKPIAVSGNTFSVYIDGKTEVVATVGLPTYTLTYTSMGLGSIEVYDAQNADESPAGNLIASGSEVVKNTPLFIYFIPSKSEGKVAELLTATCTVADGDPETWTEDDGYLWKATEGYDADVWQSYMEMTDDMVIAATFADTHTLPSGIGEIIVDDDDDAPVKVYNLQGIEVNADHLVPGVYIVKRGSKTQRVLVR